MGRKMMGEGEVVCEVEDGWRRFGRREKGEGWRINTWEWSRERSALRSILAAAIDQAENRI